MRPGQEELVVLQQIGGKNFTLTGGEGVCTITDFDIEDPNNLKK